MYQFLEKAFQHLVDFLHIFKGYFILIKYLKQLSIYLS